MKRLLLFCLLYFFASVILSQTSPCEILSLHPNNDDFGISHGECGKILITSPDNVYYANQKGKTYQSTESEILIKAVLTKESQAGQRVYFRILDPPDQSSYLDGEDDDNVYSFGITDPTMENISDPAKPINIKLKPKVGQSNSFDNSLQYSQIYSIESSIINGEHTAELILEFTKLYAGNNYVIEVSLDINFAEYFRTPVMVGWKRQIIQEKSMFKTGTCTNGVPNGGNVVTVFRFDPEDLEMEDEVIVYGIDDNGQFLIVETTITGLLMPSVVDEIWTITFQDLQGINFPRFSGVIRKSDILNLQNEIISTSYYDEECTEMYFGNAFGSGNCGLDGGAFIEFSFLNSNKENVEHFLPHFPFGINGPLDNVDHSTFDIFLSEWNGIGEKNVFFCNWAGESPMLSSTPGKGGHSWPATNNTAIYVKSLNPGTPSFERRLNNLVIHEMGHHNGVSAGTNSHVDDMHFNNHQNDNFESCIMCSPIGDTYSNDIFEFDIDDTPTPCLKAIRNTETN